MRELKAFKQGRLYVVLRDGKHWFSHSNPNAFRGMVINQLSRGEIAQLLQAQAA